MNFSYYKKEMFGRFIDDEKMFDWDSAYISQVLHSPVQNSKANTGGGMGARMSPSAILVIQNGMTRLVNIRHQDAMTKALDMVPDLVNRFVGGKDISPEAMEKAEDMKAGYEAEAKEEK